MGHRLCPRHVQSLEFNCISQGLRRYDGADDVHRVFFERLVAKVSTLHEAIDATSYPAVELVLKRKCADVCKAVYTLRANGDRIPMATLLSYDELLRTSLGRTLGGPIGQDAWDQAATTVFSGGLGFRRASDVALPAFIASRTASWPGVKSIYLCAERPRTNVAP